MPPKRRTAARRTVIKRSPRARAPSAAAKLAGEVVAMKRRSAKAVRARRTRARTEAAPAPVSASVRKRRAAVARAQLTHPVRLAAVQVAEQEGLDPEGFETIRDFADMNMFGEKKCTNVQRCLELLSAAGMSLLASRADWTDSERTAAAGTLAYWGLMKLVTRFQKGRLGTLPDLVGRAVPEPPQPVATTPRG